MSKAVKAGAIVTVIYFLSILVKVDPSSSLITLMAYWVLLDRLERDDEKED